MITSVREMQLYLRAKPTDIRAWVRFGDLLCAEGQINRASYAYETGRSKAEKAGDQRVLDSIEHKLAKLAEQRRRRIKTFDAQIRALYAQQ